MSTKTEKANDSSTLTFSGEEVGVWHEAGLIPDELVGNPDRGIELVEFVRKNKDQLFNHYREPKQETPYSLTLPPPDKWDTSYELQVIDKRTGEVVRILEKGEDLEICEGLKLKIKSKEAEQWKKETAKAKNLNKEQSKMFKEVVQNIIKERPLSREEIVKIIEEVEKKGKKKKYRQSGHLIDQKLKYSKPNKEPSLFDMISPEVQQKIEDSKIEVRAEGIKLTHPENKLVHAFNKILFEKTSNNNAPKKDGFYEGNCPSELLPYGQFEAKATVLKFKPSELYTAYMDGELYGGNDIQYINKLLYQLESRKFLIIYDRIKSIKGKELTDRIEDFQSLIHIKSFIPDLTDDEKKRLNEGDASIRESRGEIVLLLNPIFTDQIDTKFIEFPTDTSRRLTIAAGGHKRVTASMERLLEYLHRELSNKRYTPEINEENLPYVLGLENYVKQKRKKLLRERIEKDFEAIRNMGIVHDIQKIANSKGGMKWVFQLNREYE